MNTSEVREFIEIYCKLPTDIQMKIKAVLNGYYLAEYGIAYKEENKA